jgi:hypothetical protein
VPDVRNRDGTESFFVTTSDRKAFVCFVETVGGVRVSAEKRWIFESTTTRYVGPTWFALAHERELQQLVDEWWEIKKALDQGA